MATIRRRPGPLAALLAAEVVSTTGSMVVLAIPGGAVAGRLGARRTMLACDLARLPLVGLVPLLHAVGALSFPVLVGLVALHGLFWPPYWASQGALLPELVGDDRHRPWSRCGCRAGSRRSPWPAWPGWPTGSGSRPAGAGPCCGSRPACGSRP
ncbi:MAG: hypothetical protein ACJ782_24010 [Actinomycetota bacterium]